MEVGTELFSLCNDVITAACTPSVAMEKLRKKQEEDKELPSQLIDILFAVEGEAKQPEEKIRLLELLKMISETMIPYDILSVELECLDANNEQHKKSIVRQKTRLYFKQSKFNLMREESEGYAKLVTELLDMGSSASAETMNTRVFCLIGQFNLDPNRVIDVVLECFECVHRQKNFFISLLKEMKPNADYLLTLVGFQFSFYHAEGKKTPYSLYVMTAALIQAGLLELMKITAHLKPNFEGIKDGHRARAANASVRAKKAETIVTTQVVVESSRSRDMDRETSEGGPVMGIAFEKVAAIQDGEDEKLTGELSEEAVLGRNQKLGLVCALLEEGEWTQAQHLIDRLPEFYAVQASPRICRAIASLVDKAMNDFYREKCAHRLISVVSKKKDEVDKDAIPKVTSFNGFVEGLVPVLWYLGPRIGYHNAVTAKLIRLVTVFFEERAKDPSSYDEKTAAVLMSVIDEVLLPSLSLLVNSPNAALSEELWQLLQLFPYQHRYRLYGRWKTHHSVRHPELCVVRAKVLGRTKYILKRLSKETVKIMGRQLGKLCHTHPMTVLEYMLSMVQTFDNFIGPVVESLKFLTSLEFDILSFCLIEQLASPDRQQLKQSDGNLSPWLQALGTMVGSIYKKYNVELVGILNYVANQLKNEKGYDLLILREIINNMSSVESSVTATQDQLEALQGGEVLRLEAGGFSNARNKRASTRLRDALLDENLAVGLCILIAQQREFIIHRESSHLPLKLVGEMVDQCRDTLIQYGTFLMQSFKAEEYSKRMPSAAELMEDFGLPIDTAMFLTRSFFLPKIIAAYDESKKISKALEGEGKTKLDAKQKFVFFKSAMDGVVEKMIKEVEGVKMMATKQLSQINRSLLVTFWMLSSYDIEVPVSAYDKAVDATRKLAREAADSVELSKSKRHKEVERLTNLETRLREEQRRQSDHVDRVRMWLSSAQETLFTEKGTVSVPFLASCVMKRAVFSESDAIFCAKFVLQLTSLRTAYFQTIVFFDKIFVDLLPTISGLTENEAICFGRFLDCLMTSINRWNFDKDAFDKECSGYPGFYLKTVKNAPSGPLDHTTYKYLTYKWQIRCCGAFTSVLSKENAEYVMIRNCLVIMAKMFNSFPVMKENHSAIEEVITQLRDREKGKRNDLALKALSYVARMRTTADKMVEKAVYSPKHATKKTATAKANGTTATATNDRKRPITTAAAPEAKKKVKAENGEKKEKEEKRKEGETEEKLNESKEEGEVSPDPPPKKPRTSIIAKAAAANGNKGRAAEKERPAARVKEEKTERKEEKAEPRPKEERKTAEKKEDKEPRGKEEKESKGKDDKAEKRERSEEPRRERIKPPAEKKDSERMKAPERKEERRAERRETEKEKSAERRESSKERRDANKESRRVERREKEGEAKEERSEKKKKEVEVAGPALPPGMKEKENKVEKRVARREPEREERRSITDRIERSDERKRAAREASKDEPNPKIQRSLSSGKMASDRMEDKSRRHHDDRASSPPYRRQSKETSSRARR